MHLNFKVLIKERILSTTFILLLTLSMVSAGQNSGNCSRLVIILLDETDSFGAYTKHGVAESLYWQDALHLSRKIVQALKQGDKLVVLAINEKGFEEEDILIPLQQFEKTFMRAKVRKNKIVREILNLKRSKDTYSATDIVGALHQASYFANKSEVDETIVFCFSDMRQEPRWPSQKEVKGLQFPENSKGYFLFVDASGKENWDKMINIWHPVLTRCGLCKEGKVNFCQYGESQSTLYDILQKW